MPTLFDHEKLDAYRVAIDFLAWTGPLIDERLAGVRLSVPKHLDEASTSVALNIAEGNGKRSLLDRARILDIARGSALESAACLDVLVARGRITALDAEFGKGQLVRVVSMLTKLIERLLALAAADGTPSTSTRSSTSTSTSTSTKPSPEPGG